MGLNRGKRSLVLDLKQQGAKDALWRLIDGADVFVHSMRPQKIEKLGFGHQAVCARNPRIVYAGHSRLPRAAGRIAGSRPMTMSFKANPALRP